MTARPIPTPEQVEAYDGLELFEGFMDRCLGDPEPGPNRSDAFWWGWWCRRNPSPDDPDPRAVQIYWAMRAYAKHKNGKVAA